jgi:hypothetical protein
LIYHCIFGVYPLEINLIKKAAARVMRIGGYLSYRDGFLVALLMAFQNESGITGGAVEIGVHHGRLILLMAQMLQSDERVLAIDLFDDQKKNTDGSGKGNKEIFLANSRRLGMEDRISTISAASQTLNPDEIKSALQMPARMFSVDGSHVAKIVTVDMQNAENALCAGGIVVVDDYWNFGWPDVSYAVLLHYASGRSDLYPFAVSSSKLFLTKGARFAAQYFDFLVNQRQIVLEKRQKIGSSQVAVFDNRGFREIFLTALRLIRREVRG